jgi:hypothetical protein
MPTLDKPRNFHLEQQKRNRVREEFAAWIKANAGTELDLDPELEAAGIENLLENTTWLENEAQ